MDLQKIKKLNIHATKASIKIPIAIGILIILVYVVIVPQLKKLIETKQTLASKNAEKTLLEAKELELRQLDSYYSKNADQIAKIKQSIPKNKETSDFAVQIEGLTNRNSLSLNNFKLIENKNTAKTPSSTDNKSSTASSKTKTAQTTTSKANEISFEFIVSGDYNKTLNFVGELEKLIRFTEIKSINIKADNGIPETTIKGVVLIQ